MAGKPLGKQGGKGVPAPVSKPLVGRTGGNQGSTAGAGASKQNRSAKPVGGTAKPPR